MPRPKRKRRLQEAPKALGFAPISSKDKFVDIEVVLQLEEYESLRLADYEGLSQEEAATLMQISRPTFTRIYEVARKKIVKAMVENKPLLIAGGQVDFEDEWYRCHDCDDVFSGHEHDCGNDSENEPKLEHINSSLNNRTIVTESILPVTDLGYCTCPDCHFTQPKIQTVPCRSLSCPNCGRDQMIKAYPNQKKR